VNSAIVIPAYKPEASLIDFVRDLLNSGFPKIIVVDDGSGDEYASVFDTVGHLQNVVLLSHPVNKGKGRAIKTSIGYFLKNYRDLIGIVTVDADGQHALADIINVCEAMEKEQNKIVLGVRDFDDSVVPKRNRFGNRTTSRIFQGLYGAYISDTQTGLRGLPAAFLPWMLEVGGEKYDYEIGILYNAVRKRICIMEVSIRTIYNNNVGSHYRVFIDSWLVFMRMLNGLLQYSLASVWSSAADVIIFLTLNSFILPFFQVGTAMRLLYATLIARFCSSIANYALNKNVAFKVRNDAPKSLPKYYTLWLGQLGFSYALTYLVSHILHGMNIALGKILIDIFLAIASYQIQMHWVFRAVSDVKRGKSIHNS
jgi:glycosyltransferase involved in cell wall biosynthesis